MTKCLEANCHEVRAEENFDDLIHANGAIDREYCEHPEPPQTELLIRGGER